MAASLSQSIVAIPLVDTTRKYPFSAGTLAAAVAAMKRAAPPAVRPHTAGCQPIADTAAALRKTVGTKIVPNSIRQMAPGQWQATAFIEKCEFHYGFVFTVPNWSNVAALDRVIQDEWKRYMSCLGVHEKGHAKVVQGLVGTYFLTHIPGLRISSVGNTSAKAQAQALQDVRDQVEALRDQLVAQINEATRVYDKKTLHGERQGAALRTRIGTTGRYRR